MKEPPKRESDDKPTRAKFAALGTRVMAVPKAEIDERDKTWQASRTKRKKNR